MGLGSTVERPYGSVRASVFASKGTPGAGKCGSSEPKEDQLAAITRLAKRVTAFAGPGEVVSIIVSNAAIYVAP